VARLWITHQTYVRAREPGRKIEQGAESELRRSVTATHVAGAPHLQRRHQAGEDPEDLLRVEARRLPGDLQLRRRRRDRREHAVGHQIQPCCAAKRTHVTQFAERLQHRPDAVDIRGRATDEDRRCAAEHQRRHPDSASTSVDPVPTT